MLTTAPNTETLPVRTGRRLREIRKAKCMSLGDLARLMNTTVQTVSRLENGQQTLSIRWVEKFCTVLDIHPGVLFGDATFKRQIEQDAIYNKMLALQLELQRTTASMAEFLEAKGWSS
jgi:transcriptional regulator with XRE-family HTH domain